MGFNSAFKGLNPYRIQNNVPVTSAYTTTFFIIVWWLSYTALFAAVYLLGTVNKRYSPPSYITTIPDCYLRITFTRLFICNVKLQVI